MNLKSLNSKQTYIWLIALIPILWSVGGMAWTIITVYNPLPWGDLWWDWRNRILASSSLAQFWSLHNEHRILTARLFFRIDQYLCHGDAKLLFSAIFFFQFAQMILMWRWLRTEGEFKRYSPLLLVTCASLLFAVQQYANFTWSFQIQFFEVFFFGNLSIYLLSKAAQGHAKHFFTSSISAWMASFSMANGLLVWPILCLLTGILFKQKKIVLIFFAQTLACWALYLWGYQSPAYHTPASYAIMELPRTISFLFVLLGAPLDRALQAFFPASKDAYLCFDGVLGAVVLFVVGKQIWGNLITEKSNSAQRLTLSGVQLFILGSEGLTAIGRSTFLPFSEAVTSRYTSPVLLLWYTILALFIIETPEREKNKPTSDRLWLYAIVPALAVVFWGIVPLGWKEAKGQKSYLACGGEAIRAGVDDRAAWRRLVDAPPEVMQQVTDYFRSRKLSLFSTPWEEWLGKHLENLVEISQGKIDGCIDQMVAIKESARPGWKLSGWAFCAEVKPQSWIIVATDPEKKIIGVLAGRELREDVAKVKPELGTLETGWIGYIQSSEKPRVFLWLVSPKTKQAVFFKDVEL